MLSNAANILYREHNFVTCILRIIIWCIFGREQCYAICIIQQKMYSGKMKYIGYFTGIPRFA